LQYINLKLYNNTNFTCPLRLVLQFIHLPSFRAGLRKAPPTEYFYMW